MSETINGKKVFSLVEVAQSIQRTINDRYKSSFWVKAEMIKLNHYTQSGHCYPDLVEKRNGIIIAQMRANLWKEDYLKANKRFLEILHEPLKDGIKILFLAKISFEPSHGLALRMLDIDPGYTLGDLEKEKQETIQRLKLEGIFQNNKLLKMPLLPQRLALISVETSKGYADFISVIDGNGWKYKFFHFLFPSVLQGENAVNGIIKQLKRIKKVVGHFDMVAIIRGGGGDIGLSCYNDYQLAREIVLFPIPVITGIGHATNETVTEMVSFANAITPTKLAEYLIQKFHNFSVPVQKAQETIVERSRRLLSDEGKHFQSEIKFFKSVTENIFLKNRNNIKSITASLSRQSLFVFNQSRLLLEQQVNQIAQGSRFFIVGTSLKVGQTKERLSEKVVNLIKEKKMDLENTKKNVDNMNPHNVLRRGYSITMLNSKVVNHIRQVKNGDILRTQLIDGVLNSIVQTTHNTEE